MKETTRAPMVSIACDECLLGAVSGLKRHVKFKPPIHVTTEPVMPHHTGWSSYICPGLCTKEKENQTEASSMFSRKVVIVLFMSNTELQDRPKKRGCNLGYGVHDDFRLKVLW